jgi:hypothetical protein
MFSQYVPEGLSFMVHYAVSLAISRRFKGMLSFETSETTHQTTQRRISESLNLHSKKSGTRSL